MTHSAKALKPRRKSEVATESFAPGCLVEILDYGSQPGLKKPGKHASNGKGSKKRVSSADRRHLRDIETWLNNCVHLAQRLEAKEGAKILQLLVAARDQAHQLRG